MAKTNRKEPAMDPMTRTMIVVGFVALLLILFALAFAYQVSRSSGAEEDEAVRQMIEVMNDPTLKKQPVSGSQVWQEGTNRVNSGDPVQIISGLSMLLAEDPNRAIPIVQGHLSSPYPSVRIAAAQQLSTKRAPGSAVLIARLLSDPDPKVREAAAAAINPFVNEPSVVYEVSSALRSNDPEIVKSAIPVWKRVYAAEPREAQRAIRRPLMSYDPSVVADALSAISSTLPAEEIDRMRSDFRVVVQRFPNSSVSAQAEALL